MLFRIRFKVLFVYIQVEKEISLDNNEGAVYMMSRCNETKITKIMMVANKLDVTGISTVIMNYCSHMDLSKYDIIIVAGAPIADLHRDKCKALGIKLYELPNRKKNSKDYYVALDRIIKQEKPDVLHVHGNSATMTIELFLAWIHHVRVRIPHSHNTTCENMKLHKMLLPIFNHLYTSAFACGRKAGEWLYAEKQFYIIPNGFDTEKFKFNEYDRSAVRKELGIEDAFVIGHIGRMNRQKNQTFLIDLFEQFAQRNKKAVLLLVGVGPDYEKVKERVANSPFRHRIIMYGETNSPEKMYSAMDIFVLPSRYEGLPVVLVEAECSGLYCIVSDNITDEMSMDNHILKLSLNAPLEVWCDAIQAIPQIDRAQFYENNKMTINNYNIEKGVKRLERLYDDCLKK